MQANVVMPEANGVGFDETPLLMTRDIWPLSLSGRSLRPLAASPNWRRMQLTKKSRVDPNCSVISVGCSFRFSNLVNDELLKMKPRNTRRRPVRVLALSSVDMYNAVPPKPPFRAACVSSETWYTV